eukprot:1861304-Rhodomonas_salina.1
MARHQMQAAASPVQSSQKRAGLWRKAIDSGGQELTNTEEHAAIHGCPSASSALGLAPYRRSVPHSA